jgi:hypothetical protein
VPGSVYNGDVDNPEVTNARKRCYVPRSVYNSDIDNQKATQRSGSVFGGEMTTRMTFARMTQGNTRVYVALSDLSLSSILLLLPSNAIVAAV